MKGHCVGQEIRELTRHAWHSCLCFLTRFSCSSALDAENEHLVQEALDRLMEGRTVMIIAHRLSTIKNANVVAVLDQGRITECGKHEELLSKPDGIYRKLMNKQSFISAERSSY